MVFNLLYSIALQHNIALYQSYDQKDAENANDDYAGTKVHIVSFCTDFVYSAIIVL